MTQRLHRLSLQSKQRFSGVRPSQLPHTLPKHWLSGINGIAAELKSSADGGEYDGNEFEDVGVGRALPMAPSHSNVSIGSLFVLVVDDELDNSGACEPIAPNTLAVGALKLALNKPFMFDGSGTLRETRVNMNTVSTSSDRTDLGDRLTLNLN